MRARQIIAPALAVFLLGACAGSSREASAPERAQQAESDKIKAQEEARDARHNAEKARIEAQDAARAQQEADQNARWQAQRAAEAERDAQLQVAPQVAPAPAGVTERQETPVVRSGGVVAFTTGGVELSAETKARLDDVARDLRAHPSRSVVVEGYSDDTGTASRDIDLSRRRADCVARYLERDGVSSDRIVTKAAGTGRAVTTDPVYRDRVLNRHVEVIIQPEK